MALEILTLLLENPTDDSVEIAVGFLKECGQKLSEVTPRGVHGKFHLSFKEASLSPPNIFRNVIIF